MSYKKKELLRNFNNACILEDEILQAKIMQAGAVQRGDVKDARRCNEDIRDLNFLLNNLGT